MRIKKIYAYIYKRIQSQDKESYGSLGSQNGKTTKIIRRTVREAHVPR